MDKQLANEVFFAEVEELIAAGCEVRMSVRGTSMRTFLQEGDTVILRPFRAEEIQPGAIVLFRYCGRHILHRVRNKAGNELTVRGDSVAHTEQTTVTDVVAVVKEAIKSNGRIIKWPSRNWNNRTAKSLVIARIRLILYPVKKCVRRR